MRKLLVTILLLILVAAHFISLQQLAEAMKRMPRNEDTAYVVPPAVLKITTLEFDSLASDFLFLKALVFIGTALERTETPKVKDWEWKWLYKVDDASATLDPYFVDPYYLVNAYFTWDANMIEETNRLLERGVRSRSWDSMLPFFMGFNYFYFLQDNFNARKYLIEASERPDAPPLYAHLAANLSFEKNRTVNAISFLEELLKGTEDELLRKRYEARITFLKSVLEVENAAEQYKKRFGKKPADIHALVRTGMLHAIPIDPSGGQLYIDSDGRVKSSNEFPLDFLHK